MQPLKSIGLAIAALAGLSGGFVAASKAADDFSHVMNSTHYHGSRTRKTQPKGWKLKRRSSAKRARHARVFNARRTRGVA